jgi:hypothetical protein
MQEKETYLLLNTYYILLSTYLPVVELQTPITQHESRETSLTEVI